MKLHLCQLCSPKNRLLENRITDKNVKNENLKMNRKEGNEKLLQLLKDYLEANPDIRFIQALWNLHIIDGRTIVLSPEASYTEIIDRFYEEPAETLKRMGYSE